MLSFILLGVIMLGVIMLRVVMLSVIMLRVVMLSVMMLRVILLNGIMLSVVMLSDVAPTESPFVKHLKLILSFRMPYLESGHYKLGHSFAATAHLSRFRS